MEREKFRPRETVEFLARPPELNEAGFLHTWALARLLAWAILDQRPGKRASKGAQLDSDEPKKRKIRTVNAKQAGRITLAWLLDRHLSRAQTGSEEYKETLRRMINLFMECGGFKSCFEGWGTKSLFNDVKQQLESLDMSTVLWISCADIASGLRYQKMTPSSLSKARSRSWKCAPTKTTRVTD
jgi:hypothetical protein